MLNEACTNGRPSHCWIYYCLAVAARDVSCPYRIADRFKTAAPLYLPPRA